MCSECGVCDFFFTYFALEISIGVGLSKLRRESLQFMGSMLTMSHHKIVDINWNIILKLLKWTLVLDHITQLSCKSYVLKLKESPSAAVPSPSSPPSTLTTHTCYITSTSPNLSQQYIVITGWMNSTPFVKWTVHIIMFRHAAPLYIIMPLHVLTPTVSDSYHNLCSPLSQPHDFSLNLRKHRPINSILMRGTTHP